MCVTLQHRGAGLNDWKVVVTKHVRAHNHQLSKELYLYYTENRRIYDPELLVGAGDSTVIANRMNSATGQLTPLIDQVNHRAGLYRILTSSDEQQIQQQTPSMSFIVSDASSAVPNENIADDNTKQLMALSEVSTNNFETRPRVQAGMPLTAMPPLGAMILTPGTIPSRAMDGGGFCVPRVAIKMHNSWEAFHDYVAQYAFDSAQVFRTRSTVSVAARNAKTLASIAAKAGVGSHDVASYASYATASPTSRLIPDEYKWYSKLLICTYGWKRRVRGSGPRLGAHEGDPCPAMLLARMERNVDSNWHVMINRQIPEHNHKLSGHVEEIGVSHEAIDTSGDPIGELATASSTPNPTADNSSLFDSEAISAEPSIEEQSIERREIVVRVPKLQSVFNSWDDFHSNLKAYSDATYQLYRTRTTSSAKGRNKKIAQMRRGRADARKIPETWRWYSKTLTCTHGWKERHRGTGKRTAHVIRSTACPVKICATVQYMNPSSRIENGTGLTTEASDATLDNWRVVVTKHVVDHNHNLSKELYEHYRENRRIYDPDLLAIDTSSEGAVVKRKLYQVSDQATTGDNFSVQNSQQHGSQLASHSNMLSSQLEAGLVETVNHTQFFTPPYHNTSSGISASGTTALQQNVPGAGVSTSVGLPHQVVPSVVLLPYSTTTPFLPDQVQSQSQQQQQLLEQQQGQIERQGQQQQALASAVAAFTGNTNGSHGRSESTGSDGMSTVASMTPPGLHGANVMLLNHAGVTMGSNVISVACRVHGPSAGPNSADGRSNTSASRNNEAECTSHSGQCTCFRIAGGGNYVTIVPANEPIAPAETSFDPNDENMFYAEDMEGAWQPSSNIEIEQMTTESGDMIWRVPRIVRRYPSWEAFHKYLDAYSAATFQLYRVRTTYSVRSRNVRLRQLAASRGIHGVSRAHLVPESYEWYSKTFLCTHGWKRRSRGSGQRVSHNVRATECPAKVCATLQRTDGSNNWSIVVTKHLTEHNHELSETLYQQYSEVRRVRDPELLAQAEQLWRGGATRRRIFEFLKERSPNQVILMKDVHNLVQRWQSQERRPRMDQQDGDKDSAQGQENQQYPSQETPAVVAASHDNEDSPWL
ncbi:hypothetical protein PHMEG_00066 [Phytophthora megakarya]|uniref:FAR1 domain-containing protein n=1 Tax=Phytophthora megakarya TaxID=4795 RepID=A0A225X631_9STRA|nr:hypothetical protein PHMEG_00066 [Phytophthora megakarya]